MANRLKELRKAQHKFQIEVAQTLGISQATLSGWETGRIQISRDDLFKLASYYNVSIDYILGYSDDPNKRASLTETERELVDLCKDATSEQIKQITKYAQFILSHEDE